MTTSPLDLSAAFPVVERAVAEHSKALQGVSALKDYDTYRNTCRSADSALELAVVQIGGVVRDKGSETAVRVAGIRATSTMGLGSALSNWLTAARKRLPTTARLSIKSLTIEVSGDADAVAGATAAIGGLLTTFASDPFNPHGSGPVPIEERTEQP
jgi:hypothetical protein